jgi:hypothetical protein
MTEVIIDYHSGSRVCLRTNSMTEIIRELINIFKEEMIDSIEEAVENIRRATQ